MRSVGEGTVPVLQPRLGPGDWVTHHARYQPTALCLVRQDGDIVTYAEADRTVTRLAHALRKRGVEKGTRIGIVAVDSPEQFMFLLACMKLGATFVALNYRLARAEIETLLCASRPDALVISSRYAQHLPGAIEAIGGAPSFVAAFEECPEVELTVAALVDEAHSDAEIESCAVDEDVLSIAFTSGTTGLPKGVLQSQRMIRTLAAQGAMELGLQRADLIYSGAPMFHVSGFGHILYGMSRGAASLIIPQFDSRTLLRWLKSGQLRHAMLIPSMIMSLMQEPDVREGTYDGVRTIMYGGAPMPPALIRELAEVFDCGLLNGFGAGTEAAGQTIFGPADHRRALAGEEHLLGSIGRPIYGVDVKLCDPEGIEVAPGEVGEIWSRSDSVMSGYLDRPEIYANSVRDGWFHAGDLAWRDADGYLFLAGRVDDMIIRGGKNVYPVEIEDVLADHDAVLEAAVIGEADSYWGEVVTAVVSLRPGKQLTYDELVTHCRPRLAGYKIPHRLVVVDDFPKNPTGKIRKGELRRAVATGELG